MSDELRTYKRLWIYKWRHKPAVVETAKHRQKFRITVQYWKAGKCIHCGILKDQAPNHNCLTLDLEPDMALDFVAALFEFKGQDRPQKSTKPLV